MWQFAVTELNVGLDAIHPRANSGIIRIYDGVRPASPASPAAGTVLAELTLDATAFGPASGGSITAGPITREDAALAGGTATWFRVFRSDGVSAWGDGDVTVVGGGGDMQLVGTATIVVGLPLEIASFVLTWP